MTQTQWQREEFLVWALIVPRAKGSLVLRRRGTRPDMSLHRNSPSPPFFVQSCVNKAVESGAALLRLDPTRIKPVAFGTLVILSMFNFGQNIILLRHTTEQSQMDLLCFS